MATRKNPLDLRVALEKQLQASVGTKGGIDKEKLKKANKPLADLFNELVASKTTRDDPIAVAKDLANLINVRDPSSGLGKAAKQLEKAFQKETGSNIGGLRLSSTLGNVKPGKTPVPRKKPAKTTASKAAKKSPKKPSSPRTKKS